MTVSLIKQYLFMTKEKRFCLTRIEPEEQVIKKDRADPYRSTVLVLSSEKPDPLGTLLEASNQKQKVALNNRT
jgi:hypothetical protein